MDRQGTQYGRLEYRSPNFRRICCAAGIFARFTSSPACPSAGRISVRRFRPADAGRGCPPSVPCRARESAVVRTVARHRGRPTAEHDARRARQCRHAGIGGRFVPDLLVAVRRDRRAPPGTARSAPAGHDRHRRYVVGGLVGAHRFPSTCRSPDDGSGPRSGTRVPPLPKEPICGVILEPMPC